MNIACTDCGNVLTDEERHYYGDRCNQCELEWSERITIWRKGGDDEELDSMFDVPEPTTH